MSEPQTTPNPIFVWSGRICFVLMWPVYFLFMLIIGALDGMIQMAKKLIKWTPEIWKGMH